MHGGQSVGSTIAHSLLSEVGSIEGQASTSVRQQIIIITGPTAVGKTAAAVQLAQQLNGEIISADSVQIYRGLDIGSDKVRVMVTNES